MTPEQILAAAETLANTRTTYTRVLNQAADVALTRRMFGVEKWLRRWADTPINLAGQVPAEYVIAVEAAHLIVEGH